MIEHGSRIEPDFKGKHGQRRSAQWHDDKEFDSKRKEDFDGVEASTGCHVKVEDGMVHPVETPKHGHAMKKAAPFF